MRSLTDNSGLAEQMELAKAVAVHFARGRNIRRLEDDLVGQAYLILVQERPKYDPERTTLGAFLTSRIRHRLIDWLRNSSDFSRGHLAQMKAGVCRQTWVVDADLSELIASRDEPASDLEEYVLSLLAANPQARMAFERWYFRGQSMLDIGRDLGISESRVSQIVGQARRRLARRLSPEAMGMDGVDLANLTETHA